MLRPARKIGMMPTRCQMTRDAQVGQRRLHRDTEVLQVLRRFEEEDLRDLADEGAEVIGSVDIAQQSDLVLNERMVETCKGIGPVSSVRFSLISRATLYG